MKLRLEQTALSQIGVREGDREDSEGGEEDLEEEGEVVTRRELVISRAALPENPAVRRGRKRERETGHGRDGDRAAATWLWQHEVNHDREQEEPGKRHDGCDLAEVGQRLRPRVREVGGEQWAHLASPVCPSEVIRLVSTFGSSPMANIRTTRGASRRSWPA